MGILSKTAGIVLGVIGVVTGIGGGTSPESQYSDYESLAKEERKIQADEATRDEAAPKTEQRP